MNPQKKVNLVLLTDCLADLEGGAEKQIFELAKGLDRDRYDVVIASLESLGNAPRERIEAAGCRLEIFPVKRIYGLSGLIQGIRFVRFLKRRKTDVLQTYHFSSDVWGTVFARLAGVKTVFSNRRDMGFWRKKPHLFAYRLVNPWVSRIIAVSDSVGAMVRATEQVPAGKVAVIHNGIEFAQGGGAVAAPAGLRSQWSMSAHDPVIMHVANLAPVKGHQYLLAAMKVVKQEFPRAKLLLIGGDESAGAVHRWVEEMDLKGEVLFLGKRRDVRALLPQADVCVMPSLSEGMSNAILEYMAAGKAVVATAVGGNPELIEDGKTGVLVPAADTARLRDAILRLLRDEGLRHSLGANAREKVRRDFSMSAMLKNYEDLYRSFFPVSRKILHLVSSGGFFGAENVILTLSRQLSRRGHAVTVAALKDLRDPHTEIIEQAKRDGLATVEFTTRGKMDLPAVQVLAKYLKDNGFDILHTHNYKSDAMGCWAARLAGVPVVATAHGFTEMDRKVGLYEKLDRYLLRNFFNRVVVVTEAILPDMSPGKRRIIPNGLSPERFSPNLRQRTIFRDHYGIAEHEVLIGTVGRLSTEKNQALLLKAFKTLLTRRRDVKLLLVGSGPQETELKELAKALHLQDRVVFTGLLTEMAAVYQAMDIFVLCSLTEGVPMTILEAMASRVPVIATRVGGIPGMIEDGRTGILVPSNDAAALLQALEKVANDRGLARGLAEAAQHYVAESFSEATMAERYQRIYEEVLEER